LEVAGDPNVKCSSGVITKNINVSTFFHHNI
jgi:hypothetical protein